MTHANQGESAMDFNAIAMRQMMQTRMGYLAERQDVLSQNIANSDTPGYAPRDLKDLDFRRVAAALSRKVKMRATNPTHILDPKLKSPAFKSEEARHTFETDPVENAVVLEEQMAKMSETSFNYQATINLYRKNNEMFKTAIGRGGSQ